MIVVGVRTVVGRTLGRYQILKHLASGGMAEVYLARTAGLEGFVRHVVIKRIRAKEARDNNYVKMFLDEARLAATLHHHNIVQVHDVGQEDDEWYLAMEYIHGKDARALAMKAVEAKEHLPLEHVVSIVSSAAAGLHHAHEQLGPDRKPLGLVHRDVSPSNILVGYDGSIKVADFGIAKAVQRSVETHSGTLKGKVAYMSPEQCRGKPVDRRSDVFALGIVLYELATGRRLFKAESEFMSMSAIVAGTVPAPTRFRPDLPPELELIIMKALATNPDERYGTADALRRALEELATAIGLRMSTTSLADYMKQLFGARVEPWLVDQDSEEAIDHESSGSGISEAPELSLSGLEVEPDAPIAVARRRAITSVPLVDDTDAPALASRPTRTSMMVASVNVAPAPPSRRKLGWIAGGAVVLALGVVGTVKLAGGTADAPAPEAPPAPPPAVAPVAAAPPPAPTSPVVVAPSPPIVPVVPVVPVHGPVAKPAKPKPHVVKPKPTQPVTPDPEWDRTSLFPK